MKKLLILPMLITLSCTPLNLTPKSAEPKKITTELLVKKTPAKVSQQTHSLKENKLLKAWIRHLVLQQYLDAIWQATYGIPGDLAPIAQCIKNHESGNYGESSHISSGSGAYQFIPSTWRHWFGLWATSVAYTGGVYSYAYLAPPEVQDAVLVYTLTHGGAHNWDMAFGNDPCTANMP